MRRGTSTAGSWCEVPGASVLLPTVEILALGCAVLLLLAVGLAGMSWRATVRATRLSHKLAAVERDHALLAQVNDGLAARLRHEHERRLDRRYADGGDTQSEPVVEDGAVVIRARPLLNGGEQNVLAACEAWLSLRAPTGWRVLAQVSLGELLAATADDDALAARAFRTINAKRCDLVIVDADFVALAAIEYQGRGHYRGDAALRDRIKRSAIGKAGIAWIEIPDGASQKEVMARLDRGLGERLATACRERA